MSDAIATRDELYQKVRDVVALGEGNRKAAIAFAAKVLNLPFDRVRRLYYGQARRIEAHEADQIRAYVEQASALIQSRAEYEAQRDAFLRNHPRLARLAPPALARTQAIEEAERLLRVLSLGAGVQSSTLALMAAHGEIGPMPDCAIFADTGWEPPHVYTHLNLLETLLPFPVHRVSGGNLRDDLLANASGKTAGKRSATPPLFVVGKDGREAMLWRQCTSAYKVEPIHRELLGLLGHKKGTRHPTEPAVELWIGISTDEAHRVKPAAEKWIKRRWPLIDGRMSRWDCLRWMDRNGYERPGKSSCIGCPYHSDNEWRRIRDDAESWADAVFVDEEIRGGLRGTDGPLYLHRSLTPLADVDLSTDAERGQPDLFGNECEGMCGV